MRRFVFATLALIGSAACSAETATPPAETKVAEADEMQEPPFFHVENNGTGPLTMAELQINIPSDLDAMMSEGQRECFLAKVEDLIAEAGDPETLSTADVPYLPAQEEWDDLPRYGKRGLLAQAVLSRAITLC